MSKRITSFVIALAILALTTQFNLAEAAEFKRAPKTPVTIELVAGGTSGSWYSIFASIAEIVNKEKCNITLKVLPGGGISNPAVVGKHGADMGLMYGSFGLAARAGKNPYNESYTDLCAVTGGFMPMYLEISALSKSKISSFKDALTGKPAAKILTGIKSTSTGWYFDRILEFYKISASDISKRGGNVTNSEYGDWPQMATDGHTDLMFNHIGIPSRTLQEIATAREVTLLSMPKELIDYFVKNHAMQKVTVKAGTYKFQKNDIQTVVSPTVLAVNKKVSDDAVYTLLEVLSKNQNEIRKIHPTMAAFNVATSWKSAGVPLHPGAEKYFKDKGFKK
ncbi:MAG: TAXI family TRAP transporter solute-binding subunit [Synergistaceae bacterium]|nr:TAXI family TRAP transporter solute-binding subunit [Synergistaceae bacterium]